MEQKQNLKLKCEVLKVVQKFSIRKLLSIFVPCLILSPEKHYWIFAKNIRWQRLPYKSGIMK